MIEKKVTIKAEEYYSAGNFNLVLQIHVNSLLAGELLRLG
jgi:hypothetical protein